jgi:hypothetical protein
MQLAPYTSVQARRGRIGRSPLGEIPGPPACGWLRRCHTPSRARRRGSTTSRSSEQGERSVRHPACRRRRGTAARPGPRPDRPGGARTPHLRPRTRRGRSRRGGCVGPGARAGRPRAGPQSRADRRLVLRRRGRRLHHRAGRGEPSHPSDGVPRCTPEHLRLEIPGNSPISRWEDGTIYVLETAADADGAQQLRASAPTAQRVAWSISPSAGQPFGWGRPACRAAAPPASGCPRS